MGGNSFNSKFISIFVIQIKNKIYVKNKKEKTMFNLKNVSKMKNLKVMMMTLMMCLVTMVSFGQWTYKTVNSEFDDSFKKAYTQTNNSGYLMMEVGEATYNDTIKINRPFLALDGSYFCDDYAYIDFVLVVNGVNKKYELRGTKSNDSRIYYFDESIWTDDFIKDFKAASNCSIRVNQEYCQDDYYRFVFSGSTAAYNFITK